MLSQRKSFFACRTFWRNRLRKKSLLGAESIPQRLKPNSLQSIYVRAEARTLQRPESLSAAWKAATSRALVRSQNPAQAGFEFRIFEVESQGAQASRQDPLALQDRGLSHFAESQPQRKGRNWKQRWAAKNTPQRASELQIRYRVRRHHIHRAGQAACLQCKLDRSRHIRQRHPADPLPAAA